MKKTKMINSEISYTISKMGHTDSLTIGDCGLPIPDEVKRIDLALTHNIPTFIQTLDVVLEELCVEEVVIAEEILDKNMAVYEEILKRFENITITKTTLDKSKVVFTFYLYHAHGLKKPQSSPCNQCQTTQRGKSSADHAFRLWVLNNFHWNLCQILTCQETNKQTHQNSQNTDKERQKADA